MLIRVETKIVVHSFHSNQFSSVAILFHRQFKYICNYTAIIYELYLRLEYNLKRQQ